MREIEGCMIENYSEYSEHCWVFILITATIPDVVYVNQSPPEKQTQEDR